ncbi:2-(R)-hydroxypropyl-CoM dehydrogenase [Pseudoalteromonas sp. P1-9]|uniref:SDR family NAD(P)-dependent oxidoreductase n=1 Tax=Pseudoalteromonas sp. P1-9 TaxID=1710354 RepID=UPI0006D5E673|nr:SDR family oxidoreductase [Pseudoalteromonas sp. P1-9]KPV97737.1 2-(R)-hydroxypropyl-CoM dehydrogenase [Pseudoalteromonas sp. P1-9]
MSKVAIVTGGSKGIGLATVSRLIDDGYTVYNLDISPSEVGHFIDCDVSNVDAVAKVIANIGQQHQSIDVVVSNAGRHLSANIENTSEQMLDVLFSLNVKGAFSLIKHALPFMKQNGGAIVLVASDQALIGKRNSFAYNLSKAALASMARTTALDYAEYNIRANAVCPGTIETPLYHAAIDSYCDKSGANKAEVHAEEEALQPLNRLGQATEVADYIGFLVSDKATFITGSLQVIDGGYTAQ